MYPVLRSSKAAVFFVGIQPQASLFSASYLPFSLYPNTQFLSLVLGSGYMFVYTVIICLTEKYANIGLFEYKSTEYTTEQHPAVRTCASAGKISGVRPKFF